LRRLFTSRPITGTCSTSESFASTSDAPVANLENHGPSAILVEHEIQLLASALQRVVEGLPEGGQGEDRRHGQGEGVFVVEGRGRYEVRLL
jgi:hypothetical protein